MRLGHSLLTHSTIAYTIQSLTRISTFAPNSSRTLSTGRFPVLAAQCRPAIPSLKAFTCGTNQGKNQTTYGKARAVQFRIAANKAGKPGASPHSVTGSVDTVYAEIFAGILKLNREK